MQFARNIRQFASDQILGTIQRARVRDNPVVDQWLNRIQAIEQDIDLIFDNHTKANCGFRHLLYPWRACNFVLPIAFECGLRQPGNCQNGREALVSARLLLT